jgi:pimeloyl-ACP methyl ester carboxylesterase
MEHVLMQGLRTRIRVQDDGPPLLLINGIWGELKAWQRLQPYLTRFMTIAFDAPGIGGTQIPLWPMSLPALARFALGVLDAFDGRRARVLGVSFGGIVAQEVATEPLPNQLRLADFVGVDKLTRLRD